MKHKIKSAGMKSIQNSDLGRLVSPDKGEPFFRPKRYKNKKPIFKVTKKGTDGLAQERRVLNLQMCEEGAWDIKRGRDWVTLQVNRKRSLKKKSNLGPLAPSNLGKRGPQHGKKKIKEPARAEREITDLRGES